MRAEAAHNGLVVRFPAPRARKAKPTADALAKLCSALEIKLVPVTRGRVRANETAAVATLRRILTKHGEQHLVMLIRTIAESEGNARALVAPIIWAISDLMLAFPAWPNGGSIGSKPSTRSTCSPC